ncbi:MAG: YwaF family protein [Spiroplasma sp.]|nr:YwaF family protein [Spiroplasma sp.]
MNINRFFNPNLKEIVSPLFGTNHLIALILSISIFASLFIFKRFYARLSRFNAFRYTLGSIQILIYILYYTVLQIYSMISWKDYMPFHLSSVLDLTSAFLLFFASEKLFSWTFPLIGPVILSFLLPDVSKRVYGPDNFYYYQYYLNHLIIFFGYFYLYLYGHIEYNKKLLFQGVSTFTLFALFVFIFNLTFGTNFLFLGNLGFSAGFGSFIFNTGLWPTILRFLFMWIIGLIFVFSFHFSIIRFLPPFYFAAGTIINQYYQNKITLLKKLKLKKQDKIDLVDK